MWRYLILGFVFCLWGCAALDERQRAFNEHFYTCSSEIPNSLIC